jgi:hypothetical protein
VIARGGVGEPKDEFINASRNGTCPGLLNGGRTTECSRLSFHDIKEVVVGEWKVVLVRNGSDLERRLVVSFHR